MDSLEELYTALRQRTEVSYFGVSALAFLTYDVAIILSKEVEHIWKQKWTVPKALYLFARYYGILYLTVVVAVNNTPGDHLSVAFCRHFLSFYAVCGNIFFTTVVNVILLLRLSALYKHDRRVICFLIAVLAAEFSVELYVTVRVTIHIRKTAFVAPAGVPLNGCLAIPPSLNFTLASWIPCLLLTAILFLMSVVQILRTCRIMVNKASLTSRIRNNISPLFAALLRDGALHFLCITVILIINTIVTITAPEGYSGAATEWLIAVYSISGSRLILNLRASAQREKRPLADSGIALQTFRAPPVIESQNWQTYSQVNV